MGKQKRTEEIPDFCPQIDFCQTILTKDEYDALCDSSNWIYCEKVLSENIAKYNKKPKEWKKEA